MFQHFNRPKGLHLIRIADSRGRHLRKQLVQSSTYLQRWFVLECLFQRRSHWISKGGTSAIHSLISNCEFVVIQLSEQFGNSIWPHGCRPQMFAEKSHS